MSMANLMEANGDPILQEDLEIIASNTTEAGIEYIGTEKITDAPPDPVFS